VVSTCMLRGAGLGPMEACVHQPLHERRDGPCRRDRELRRRVRARQCSARHLGEGEGRVSFGASRAGAEELDERQDAA
jgi:hypothetical protein